MTDEELTAIEQRAQAASPPPWREEEFTHRLVDANGEPLCAADVDGADAGLWHRPDGIFVTHAREDVLALAAEVRRLRKVCADVEGALPANARLITDDTENVDLPESVKSLTWCWKHGEKSPAQCHICDNDD